MRDFQSYEISDSDIVDDLHLDFKASRVKISYKRGIGQVRARIRVRIRVWIGEGRWGERGRESTFRIHWRRVCGLELKGETKREPELELGGAMAMAWERTNAGEGSCDGIFENPRMPREGGGERSI